ncbi:esterase [Dokdonia sinensis]|uniref:Esterase n=1 Tax=Dokdonia sinensis TaxID=2479847 RepID=A0A3M0G2H4_9FLAO|nr:alpha/beta hydrolase-fold protein [Dokdonia sinensis]RMB56392.1 esterase [Dokdonia sinensis]
MKKTILLLFLLVSAFAKAQVEYRELTSEKLGATRQIKVQLPRNYSANTEKNYPVIIVMDGDYLFEPVAGNVDYYSYWEEMPDAIVVGILQGDTRDDDTFYDDVNFLPDDTGAAFFEFVGLELMPYLDANYRTANFRIAVGHDLTANFINFYLMKDPSLFQGYISLSPDLSPMMEERLVQRLGAVEQKVFYYLATATDDIKVLREPINALNGQLNTVSNPMVKTYFDNFDEATHYSLVGRAIPQALEDIFSISRPISKKEYKETILNLPGSPYDYLIEKYAVVKELFGLDEKIRVNDFIATSTALEKRSDWEGLERLGKLARQQYPDTMLGNYYLALSMENTGSPKKAMKTYQNGFLLEEVAFITKDLMLDKAAKIKEDFGY